MQDQIIERSLTSKILVVDDSLANLELTAAQLRRHTFEVFLAQDGKEALNQAESLQPDLILLDGVMPGIAAFETCRLLKQNEATRQIPVIFMTGVANIESAITAFAEGGIDYVIKPFRFEELLARITAQLNIRLAYKRLQASEARFRTLFETAADGILIVDLKSGMIRDVNSSLAAMLGYKRFDFLGKKLTEVPPFRTSGFFAQVLAKLEAGKLAPYEHCKVETRNRLQLDIECTGTIYEVNGVNAAQLSLRDVSDRVRAEGQVQFLALHDGLTRLPNRTLLLKHLRQAIALAARNRRIAALLVLDLDHFKNVNESLGHSIGDCLLEGVALRLKHCLRESDIVARLGGDEFAIVLPEVSQIEDIERVAQKILQALLQCFSIEGHEIYITGSIGAGVYPADGATGDNLLTSAESAMYDAKAKGRGLHCFFALELNEAVRQRQRLVNELHHALEREEFYLYYQPQVSANTSEITGFEALLRWKHPEFGSVSPSHFIPLLEDLGLIVQVGDWVFKKACLQNASWQSAGLKPVRMTVNLSVTQFYRGDIVRSIQEALHESKIAPKWLELELTEGITMDDTEFTIQKMTQLKALGITLALDDFGTRCTSLAHLRRFPIDRLKIDRSFMQTLSEPASEGVVKGILSLAHNLNITCVAEGVETVQQLTYLQQESCSEIQGYLYSPALPPSDCTMLLQAEAPPNLALIRGAESSTDASAL